MRAEPVRAEVRGSPGSDLANRDAGRVRADDRAWAPHVVHAGQQRLLHVEALDHGLDDPVGAGQARKIRVKAAERDEAGHIRAEQRIGLQPSGPLEALACDSRVEVEQQRGNACVGKVRGNLCAHRAGAEHGHRCDS
jgi:hypothetical protein